MPKPKASKIKAVLFDLGNVLFYFDFAPAFQRLAKRSDLNVREIEDFFIQSGLEALYDSGKISSIQFYQNVRKALRLQVNYAAFKKIWNGIFKPNLPILRLLKKLQKKHRLVLISNTNSMHIDHLRRHYPHAFSAFQTLIFSYRAKRRKPDKFIYQKAIRACRANPEHIFYIDDRPDLTAAASSLGLETFTYHNNTRALLKQMKALAIL
ncbi:MAG: HAD family phosphatase [Candidatus Omnitrophica bacterium]|nr:HAD family phosphatase [Candidatus Omnitrophota bacterium]